MTPAGIQARLGDLALALAHCRSICCDLRDAKSPCVSSEAAIWRLALLGLGTEVAETQERCQNAQKEAK